MALVAHTRVGPYEIVGLVGVGGMGEVYRARDTQLKRDVAVKVLPSTVADDRERLARFRREAELLASLNHPHIAQIHGLVDTAGVPSLVMEFVEGDTLADRIERGAVPIAESLRLARQIAEAIEAAHEKGVIHRDLKPANIKVTPAGTVKVLDFGLAKVVRDDAAGPDLGSSTISAAGTRPGVVLGTAPYMSPEQARGQALDRRVDIWAFGCVLYELLTGRRAFGRSTVAETLAAVLNDEPDWAALPPATPGNITRLLRRCLDKDARQRLRDIGDARIEIDEHASTRRRWSRPPLAGLLAIGLVLAGSATLLYRRSASRPVTSPSEYVQITDFSDSAVAPSLSPDGRMVTFKVGEDFFLGSGDIYVKMLPSGDSVRLTNSKAPKYGPVFTPDGSRVAFTQLIDGWDTWTVPVLGGAPAPMLPNASGLTWLDERRVLFAEIKTGLHMGIVTATESRADKREVYFPAHPGAMAHYAYASLDRRWVLVVEMDQSHAFTSPCRLVPFDGSSPGRLVGPRGSCTSAAWSPDGEWMYFGATVGGASHLWRQKFPDGAPEQITFGPTEEEGVAVAPDGRSLITALGTRHSAVWIHDSAGERAITSEGYAYAPTLSPDGTRVFYLLRSQPSAASAELRVLDLESGRRDVVLPGVAVIDYDISRDGSKIAFTTAAEGGESQVWIAPADRRTAPRQVIRQADQVSFAADGHLIVRALDGAANAIVRIRTDGTGRTRLAAPPVMDKGAVSPDGEWVIVHSPGSGSDAVTSTQAVPVRGGPPTIVCVPVFCTTSWSHDGRFFYVAVNPDPATTFPTSTLAVPVPPGRMLPDLPAAGLDLSTGSFDLAGSRLIEHGWIAPGPQPSIFAFTRASLQRNLYRIPLH